MAKTTVDIQLRPRRQLTLPREICERLKLSPGDKLELSVEDSKLVVTPKKVLALNALREIQEAFQRSGIAEEELIEEGRKIRKELIKERYGLEYED
ncbi:MAG: AbrB/MazE/SpoVT family DNA-binding domain-containing protein [Chloroflexi bacterium]|nr:AbrB/MazE/SpoVT family DNA-binding domain-containing protein [Chloroflexota bacterium]